MCCIIYLKIQMKYYELHPMGSYGKKRHLRKNGNKIETASCCIEFNYVF
jgi:hypothetical protein